NAVRPIPYLRQNSSIVKAPSASLRISESIIAPSPIKQSAEFAAVPAHHIAHQRRRAWDLLGFDGTFRTLIGCAITALPTRRYTFGSTAPAFCPFDNLARCFCNG